MRNVLKPMKNNFSTFAIFIYWEMVDFLHKILTKLTKMNHPKWSKNNLSQKMCNVLKPMTKHFSGFCDIYFFTKWSILWWKFSENRPQYHHKWYCEHFCSWLGSSKCVSEDSEKMEKKLLKKVSSNFGAKKNLGNFFFKNPI